MTQEQAYAKLRRRVRNAHLRYCGLSFYFYLMRSFFYVLIVACAAASVMKLLPWNVKIYEILVPLIILSLALPLAILFTWLRRGSLKNTSILADKHLHLKEKISSAMELGVLEEDSPEKKEWNAMVLQDALKSVERLNLRKAFPLSNPRELRWIWIPALTLITTIMIIPQWDYLSGKKSASAEAAEKKEVKKELEKLMQRQLVIERKAKEKDAKIAAELSKQIKDLAADLNKGKIDKRDALSKLSSLEQEWEQKKEQMENMKKAMEEPISQGMKPKMTNELVEALEKNDFDKAAKELSKLEKNLKLGNIDEQGKKQLGDELKKMASLMNMDTPLAKALDNAGEMLQGNELNQALQPMQMAEMSLSDMKDLLDQMGLLEAALKDLKDCKLAMAGKFGKEGEGFGEGESLLGKGFGKGDGDGNGWGPERVGPWKPGESRRQGPGMGGPGIGRGAQAPNEKTDVLFKPDKLKGMFGDAPIQSVIPIDGASLKGQSTIGINDSADLEYSQETEKAMTKERVPLPLRNQVRLYFDAQQTAGEESTSETSAESQAPTSSETTTTTTSSAQTASPPSNGK